MVKQTAKFDLNLKNKVVLITGSCGQLGLALTAAFKSVGAKVIGTDIFPGAKKKWRNGYFKMDVTSKDEVTDCLAGIVRRHGALDVLVNNAGVSTFEPFESREEKKIDWVMDVNLKGTLLCIQSYVNLFDECSFSKGSIVNIASMYGVISPDFRIYTDCERKNSEIYGATKAGIIQMTRYFAVHLAGRNIRVNAVSPGGIYNPSAPQGRDFIKNYSSRCPMKRMAGENEITPAVLFLASGAASYITGQNLVVDGGMSCW